MNNNPLISVIVPSYNQSKFIGQTIDSILNQSYKNVEILVIDGLSTDNTVEVLKKYEEKIFWISEKDNGQTDAINKGIKLAKGEIITYLNSDDYYLENTLQITVKKFNENNGFLWLSGNYIIVDENGTEIQSLIAKYKTFLRKFLSFNLLLILNPINQPSTFLTKKLIDKVGFFNVDLRYTMDYEYWLRAIKENRPLIVTNKLSAFRIHGQSKGGSQFEKQFTEEYEVAKKYCQNNFLLILHRFHNFLINLVYKIIK